MNVFPILVLASFAVVVLWSRNPLFSKSCSESDEMKLFRLCDEEVHLVQCTWVLFSHDLLCIVPEANDDYIARGRIRPLQ